MPTTSRKERRKKDVASGGILSRIATDALVPREARQALYYEILFALKEYPELTKPIQCLFAKTFCDIMDKEDDRGIVNEEDFRNRIRERESLPALRDQLAKWYVLLLKAQPKKETPQATKEVETEDTGADLATLAESLFTNGDS